MIEAALQEMNWFQQAVVWVVMTAYAILPFSIIVGLHRIERDLNELLRRTKNTK